MSSRYPDALPASRMLLRTLIVLNWMIGAGIVVLFVFSLFAKAFLMRALHVHDAETNHKLIMGMQLMMIVGMIAVPLMHRVLSHLLAIVHTVRDGDPFVSENARRLLTIAWTTLWLEVLHLLVGAITAWYSTASHPLDAHWKFSPTRWLAIVLAFVLARVFEEGTRMREDLAATV